MSAWRCELGALERGIHSVVLCFDREMISTSGSLGWGLGCCYGMFCGHDYGLLMLRQHDLVSQFIPTAVRLSQLDVECMHVRRESRLGDDDFGIVVVVLCDCSCGCEVVCLFPYTSI